MVFFFYWGRDAFTVFVFLVGVVTVVTTRRIQKNVHTPNKKKKKKASAGMGHRLEKSAFVV
jgi:membrane protein implicated in regulation of membrane protease activity